MTTPVRHFYLATFACFFCLMLSLAILVMAMWPTTDLRPSGGLAVPTSGTTLVLTAPAP